MRIKEHKPNQYIHRIQVRRKKNMLSLSFLQAGEKNTRNENYKTVVIVFSAWRTQKKNDINENNRHTDKAEKVTEEKRKM